MNARELSTILIHIHKNNITDYTSLIKSYVAEYCDKYLKEGYLYCLYNDMFKTYGDDFYKLGNTHNTISRMS